MIYLFAALVVLVLSLALGYASQAKDLDILWRKVSSMEGGTRVKEVHHHYPREAPKGQGKAALLGPRSQVSQ